MTLKVLGTGETVQQVFWLDIRSRTCGVMLRDPTTGAERGGHLLLEELAVEHAHGRTTRANVELVCGDRAQVILRGD